MADPITLPFAGEELPENTTLAVGEEEVTTTFATGEEDPVTGMTTWNLGEEEPSTYVMGEEGPSTRMYGEEGEFLPGGGVPDPFGGF